MQLYPHQPTTPAAKATALRGAFCDYYTTLYTLYQLSRRSNQISLVKHQTYASRELTTAIIGFTNQQSAIPTSYAGRCRYMEFNMVRIVARRV